MVKNIGGKDFFEMLWQSSVKLRGALEPGEYKHPVLGLLFLKYVSDSFVEMQENLKLWTADPNNEDYYEEDEEDRRAGAESCEDEEEEDEEEEEEEEGDDRRAGASGALATTEREPCEDDRRAGTGVERPPNGASESEALTEEKPCEYKKNNNLIDRLLGKKDN